MKESFILFTEYKEQIDMLSDEQAGILLKAIFCYSAGEELPPMDALTRMAFSFIRSALDRTDDKYQRRITANRENGRLGGRPRKETEAEEPQNETVDDVEKTQEKPKKTQTKTQKPTGYFENPPEPERDPDSERDNERDGDKERGVWGENKTPSPPAALDRFCKRWGVKANAVANYSGGKLAGMDWDAVSEKVVLSALLQTKHDISFFVRNYEKILDGTFDDWGESPPKRGKKVDPDHDASRFAGIVYE